MALIPDIGDPVVALLVAAVVVMGGVIGSGVQRITKFILPWDFLTVGMFVTIAADVVYDLIDVSKFWYVFLIIGYFFGYYLIGRQKYDMLCTIKLKGERTKIWKRYIVYYDHGDRQCVQFQRWWPLFKRLVFKVHHYVSSNAEEIPNDCDFDDGYPIIRMKKSGTLAEWIDDTRHKIVKRWRFFSFREYDLYIFFAYGSMVSRAVLAMKCDALDDANMAIDDLTKRWMVSETRGSTSARRAAVNFLVDAKVEADPMFMLDNHLKSRKAAEEARKQKEKEQEKQSRQPETDGKEEQTDG